MTKFTPFFHLKGSLDISLDDNLVKMECEGKCVKLTFTSYFGLRKFIKCNQSLNQNVHPYFTQRFVKSLNLSYYIKDILIGESNKDLPSSLLGKYMGLQKHQILFKKLF